MYREKIEELKQWKENKNKKILLIKGAKYVGKTYIVKKFAIQNYKITIYIKCTKEKDKIKYQILNELETTNLETEENLETEKNLKTEKISETENIQTFIKNKKQEFENKTLVIIDNLEKNIELIEQIKKINYKEENIDIIIITSAWGKALKENYTLESKNIESMTIKPLTYNEFLKAIGEEELAKKLKKLSLNNIEEIQELKTKYVNNLKKYIYIGGMPEVVKDFSQNKDYKKVRNLQKEIINNYIKNIEETAPQLITGEIKSVLKNIPKELKKEDKRFVCKEIDKWAKEWQFNSAINWLKDTGIIYKVEKITKPEIPLIVYSETTHYKLFFLDIGLLSSMINLELAVVLEQNEIFNMNNMQFANQFIFQELTNQITTPIYYWQQEKYFHSIDFVMQNQGEIYSYKIDTIDKEDDKDLWIYHYKYEKYDCFRIKVSEFSDRGWYIDTPLYMIENIRKIHKKTQTNKSKK